jgi:subtilisin family serine protease
MNRNAHRGLVAIMAVAAAAAGAPVAGIGAPASPPPIGEPDLIATPTGVRPVVRDVLVKFEPGTAARTSSTIRTQALDAAGAAPQAARRLVGLPGVWRVPVEEGASPAAVAEALDARADVQWAVRDVPGTFDTPPNDPLFPNLWGLRNTGQEVQAPEPFTGLAGMDLGALGAWSTTQGSANVSVAVVDSGAVMDHPDLAANLRAAGARNFMPGPDDTVDPRAVGDTVNHGTHVAGTIGAVGNNGVGVTGVAWTVGMIPVRVGDFLKTPSAVFLEGLAHAGEQARIVNVSMGFGPDLMGPATDVIGANPNTLFVVAAGNSKSDNDITPAVPCTVPLPNVLCVAAIDASGAPATFTNFGATSVDVAAPGVGIQSAVPNFATVFAPDIDSDGGGTPRPAGWTQTPANEWTWDSANGTGYVELLKTPPSGTGLDQWLIEAPGTFAATGQACRLDAFTNVVLDAAQSQALVLAYKVGSGPWQVPAGSTTTGDTEGGFIPWTVDLSEIDGQTGVKLAFLAQSARGADQFYAAVINPEIKCIVPQSAGGNYDFLSGTSMAAPQVAGAAALLLAKNPDLTAAQMKHALMSTTVPMASLAGKVVTGGRVDVNAALASVWAPVAPPTPASPATRALTLRVGRTLAIRRGATRAAVPVTCPETGTATCAVTVALRMRSASRARWIALGTRRATLPAGWRGVVSVPLTRQARAILARHARVRATVIAASRDTSVVRTPARQEVTLVRR